MVGSVFWLDSQRLEEDEDFVFRGVLCAWWNFVKVRLFMRIEEEYNRLCDVFGRCVYVWRRLWIAWL